MFPKDAVLHRRCSQNERSYGDSGCAAVDPSRVPDVPRMGGVWWAENRYQREWLHGEDRGGSRQHPARAAE